MKKLVETEREAINEILELINIAEQRKLYLEKGYNSLFDWLTKHFQYSESAAHRRIQASRLITVVPEAKEKLSSGTLNLSTLAKAQSIIRWQEKQIGEKIPQEIQQNIVKQIENKSLIETERTLYQLFPDLPKEASLEKATIISNDLTKLTLSMSYESLRSLERARDILSHKFPQGTLTDVVIYLVKQFLSKKDPLKMEPRSTPQNHKSLMDDIRTSKTMVVKKPSDTEAPHRSMSSHQRLKVKTAIRHFVIKRAQGKCEYTDPVTKNKCTSTYQLEVDHIFPVALGGSNNLENLRCLCRKHNQYVAQEIFHLRQK